MNNIPPHLEKSSPIPILEINHTSDSISTSVSGSPSSQNSPLGYYISPKKSVFYKSCSPYQSISPYTNQNGSPNSPVAYLSDNQFNQPNQPTQSTQPFFRPYD